MNIGKTHFNKGRISWNKGTKGVMKAWNKGKKNTLKHTKEFKEERRKAWKGKNNPNFGKFADKHPVWKDIKKRKFDKLVRSLYKYRQWRSDVFTRDDFTCQKCGKRGVYIEADHYPKRFADILTEYKIKEVEQALLCEELWNINNGRTLCQLCHNKTKGRYRVIV